MNRRRPLAAGSLVFSVILFQVLMTDPAARAQSTQRFPENAPPAVPGQKPAGLKIRVIDGRVTADIADCPLHDVLAELAERTGIIFEVRNEPNPRISVHLHAVRVEEAIRRIASDGSILFLHDERDPDRIALARILPRSGAPPQPGLLYFGTGKVTKASREIRTPADARLVLASGTGPEEKLEAVETLLETGEGGAVSALGGALSDPAPEVRVAAVEGLMALNARGALGRILRRLEDADPEVRRSAASAVALLGSARNLRDLKPLLADPNANVAAAAESAMRALSAGAAP